MFEPHELRVTNYLPQSGFGAGGQHVGLTTQGVIVHHIATGVGVSCDSERSQYANKEKALVMLQAMLSAREPAYRAAFVPARHMGTKVQMIKDIREKTGAGLKESKDAMDKVYPHCTEYDEVIEKAVALLNPVRVDYSCSQGEWCVCGGDTQGVRQGCGYYTGKQL